MCATPSESNIPLCFLLLQIFEPYGFEAFLTNLEYTMNMKEDFKLYSEVQLIQPLPEYGFEKSDIATVVDNVKDKQGAPGYLLEFFDSNGDTLKVVAVPETILLFPHNMRWLITGLTKRLEQIRHAVLIIK